MIEGSGAGSGARSGSVPCTNGSGNIRIRNTAFLQCVLMFIRDSDPDLRSSAATTFTKVLFPVFLSSRTYLDTYLK
jgi:hypothetical protein